MKMILELRDQVLIDVDEAGRWYDKQLKGLSIDFELCVEGTFDDILLAPEAYQFRYKERVRVKKIKRFPYTVHYVVEGNKIIVIAVFHTSRDPKNWLERLDLI